MSITETEDIFLLKFFGENIHPDSFSAKELGNILITIEDSVKSVIDENYPNTNPNKCSISLVNIKDESDSLYLKTIGDPDLNNAFSDWGNSFGNESFLNLPDKAYKGVKHIHGLIKKKNCDLKIVYKREELGYLRYTDILPTPQDVLIKITTSIFGKVQKIGGDKPRVWVKTEAGQTFSFGLTQEQATELSPRLYETVSLKGQASWNTVTETLSRFSLKEINNYQAGSAVEIINELKAINSGFWDKFDTNEEIFNYLRD